MDKKKGAGPAGITPLSPGGIHQDKRAELLAEISAIDKLLGSAMERDNFGSGLNVRLMPGITYRAVQRLTALLRKILSV
jgi:hypothetical protein